MLTFKIGGWPRAAGIGGFDSHPLPSQTASYGAVFLLLFTAQVCTLRQDGGYPTPEMLPYPIVFLNLATAAAGIRTPPNS